MVVDEAGHDGDGDGTGTLPKDLCKVLVLQTNHVLPVDLRHKVVC